KSTCFIRDLKGNDLLTSSRGTDLYSITLQDTNSPNPICLMAKATSSQAWLWHRRLYTWTHFLGSKDETPEVLIDFLRLIQIGLQAQVRVVRTDKGSEFLNQTLHAYFAAEGIQHQTDVENLDKMKEKGDECIIVGYSTQSRAYRVFNKRTRTMALEHDSLSPRRKCQENVSHADKKVTTLNELDLLFSPMFEELLNGPSQVVSKSSAVTTSDESIQRQQQQTTSLVDHTTTEQSCQVQSHESTVTSNEN
nr:integrase, catalytic region, zinc finger, CCHC-type, peptidase aspartic, catalytic [Tanacetum cinerariifolium]